MLTEQRERYVALIVMGVLQGLGLGAKNEALQMLSVATRTMIFALNVLVVMLIARIFGLETLDRMKLVSALLLAGGGTMQGLATWQQMQDKPHSSQPQDEPLGYALALLALVLDALRWVILQAAFAKEPPQPTMRTLPVSPAHHPDSDCATHPGTAALGCEAGTGAAGASVGAPKQGQLPPLTKLQMVSWVMWMTTPVCLGLSLLFEPDGLTQVSRCPTAVTRLVTLLTIGVMGINLAEFGIVQWTSAVTFNVLSQLHSIPLILAGVTLFGEEIADAQVLGFGICLLGALLYSYTSLNEKKTGPPVVQAGGSELRPMAVERPFFSMLRHHGRAPQAPCLHATVAASTPHGDLDRQR
jgi:drug/metabolite transporter (DMT)-like permease